MYKKHLLLSPVKPNGILKWCIGLGGIIKGSLNWGPKEVQKGSKRNLWNINWLILLFHMKNWNFLAKNFSKDRTQDPYGKSVPQPIHCCTLDRVGNFNFNDIVLQIFANYCKLLKINFYYQLPISVITWGKLKAYFRYLKIRGARYLQISSWQNWFF